MARDISQSRRDVLKMVGAASAVGATGLAGCLDSDEEVVTIGATSTGSSTQAAAQALARAANQHSETVRVDPQETGGWTANLYEFAGGDIPAMGVDNNSLAKAMAEEGPFEDEPVDTLPMQGFIFTSLEMYWMAIEGSGIESTADIEEGGYTIYPIQPGFGTRLLTQEVIERAGLWEQNDINNLDTGDIAGAVEEGRIDAMVVYGANGVDLTGWAQEVDARAEGELYAIPIHDQFEEAIDNTAGALKTEFEPYGWLNQEAVTSRTDTVTSWALAGQWAFGPDISADATYEICRLALEHDDSIRESDPTTLDHTPDSMTDAVIADLEIHPGVADFFEEYGVWDDSWIRGEI